MRKAKGEPVTGIPLNSGVSYSETGGKYYAEVVLFTSLDAFARVTISGTAQGVVKETALSLLKFNLSKC